MPLTPEQLEAIEAQRAASTETRRPAVADANHSQSIISPFSRVPILL